MYNEMVKEVYSLASGTQAKLFGTSRYDEIEKKMNDWIEWIISKKGKSWQCWQDCWEEYNSK